MELFKSTSVRVFVLVTLSTLISSFVSFVSYVGSSRQNEGLKKYDLRQKKDTYFMKILWHTWNWLVSEVKFSSLNVHLFGRQPSTGWFCCWFQFQAWDNRHLMATFLLGCLLSPDCQGQHINWPPHVSKITLETTTRGEVWSRELQSYD